MNFVSLTHPLSEFCRELPSFPLFFQWAEEEKGQISVETFLTDHVFKNCWVLLAFWSHYWKINLYLPSNLQLSEKDKPYVDIQGLTASTMEILLDFVYTETVHVTVENVQELLPAACLLQLKGNCQVSAQIAQ